MLTQATHRARAFGADQPNLGARLFSVWFLVHEVKVALGNIRIRVGMAKAGAANSTPIAVAVVRKVMAARETMKTPYDVLGVPRNASDGAIRTAFCKAAKACHPDLNAGDPTAEEQLKRIIAAYDMLKKPQRRAAYDKYLRNRRRKRARRFAADSVAGLVSGSIVALVVWLSVSLSNTQEASGPLQTARIEAEVSQPASQQVVSADDSGGRQEGDGGRESDGRAAAPDRALSDDGPPHLQQSAGSLQPTAGPPEPQLAGEWEQVQARGDPMAIWAFTVRNPNAPESEVARSKLVALIDAAEDVSLLHLLRLVATEVIAERAQQRLIRLGALTVAKEDSVVSGAPSSNSLLRAPIGETIKAVNREQPAAQKIPGRPRMVAKRQATNHTPVKQASAEDRNTSACSGFRSCGGYVPLFFGAGF